MNYTFCDKCLLLLFTDTGNRLHFITVHTALGNKDFYGPILNVVISYWYR